MGYGEENLWAKFKFSFVALTHNIDINVSTLLPTLFYYLSPCWHATCYMLAKTNLASSLIVFTMPFKWEDMLRKPMTSTTSEQIFPSLGINPYNYYL